LVLPWEERGGSQPRGLPWLKGINLGEGFLLKVKIIFPSQKGVGKGKTFPTISRDLFF